LIIKGKSVGVFRIIFRQLAFLEIEKISDRLGVIYRESGTHIYTSIPSFKNGLLESSSLSLSPSD